MSLYICNLITSTEQQQKLVRLLKASLVFWLSKNTRIYESVSISEVFPAGLQMFLLHCKVHLSVCDCRYVQVLN